MPRIPSPGDPVAPATVTPPAEPNLATPADATVNWNGRTVGSPEEVEFTDEQLRASAGTLGLNYDTMNDEEREFVAMFARGALDSLEPGADPDNPLIPGPAADPASPAPAAPEPGVGTAQAGSGEGDDAEGTIPQDASPTSPAPVEPTVITTDAPPPGLPTFAVPSALPPAPAAPPQQQPEPEPMVYLPNGNLVPLSLARVLMEPAQGQQPPVVQPTTQPAPWGQPNPWGQLAPAPATATPPFGQEWVDERAGAEITRLTQTVEQMRSQQAAEAARQQQQHQQSIIQAIEETKAGYAQAKALTPEQVNALEDTAARLGAVGMYAQLYPGDPRRAMGAALENAYWITPEFRQHEIDLQMERARQTNAAVDAKKAAAGSTVSSAGSVPRVATPGANGRMDRPSADAAMVSMIENDPAYQNRPRR